jgi:hypothetical protein
MYIEDNVHYCVMSQLGEKRRREEKRREEKRKKNCHRNETAYEKLWTRRSMTRLLQLEGSQTLSREDNPKKMLDDYTS